MEENEYVIKTFNGSGSEENRIYLIGKSKERDLTQDKRGKRCRYSYSGFVILDSLKFHIH